MSLVALVNTPTTPQEFNVFSFHNQAEHQAIFAAIKQQKTLDFFVPVLDPIPMEDSANWLLRHQIVHNQMNGVLGIGGSDLSEVDFRDAAALEDWIDLHYSEHQQANQALGI